METTENHTASKMCKIIYMDYNCRVQLDIEEDFILKAYISTNDVADISGKPWLWKKRLFCFVDKHGVVLLNESLTDSIVMKNIGSIDIDETLVFFTSSGDGDDFAWSLPLQDKEPSILNYYFAEERMAFVEALIEHRTT